MQNKIKQLIDSELEVAALGIIGIVTLEIIALVKGVNGTMFGASMVAIGTIIGWVFKGYLQKRK